MEFVLRSSEAAAIEALIDRPVIALDDEAYDAFVAALDAPTNERLRDLVTRQPLWTRSPLRDHLPHVMTYRDSTAGYTHQRLAATQRAAERDQGRRTDLRRLRSEPRGRLPHLLSTFLPNRIPL